jgi:hypothetical protein
MLFTAKYTVIIKSFKRINMSKIIAATCFGPDGYQQYGRRMLESFRQHWPKDIVLYAYLDEPITEKQSVFADNIVYKILNNRGLVHFKQKHLNNPKARGLAPEQMKNGKQNYAWDAVRFAHKVFAYAEASTVTGCDTALWLDGDTFTHTPVTLDRIESWCPADKFAGFLDRPWLYTETGFHIFRMNHPIAKQFVQKWIDMYTQEKVFNLNGYTDCHTYDHVRKQFDQSAWHNLSPAFDHPHPFINGVLGEVMDHMKGPRKGKGSSHKKDLVVERDGYWKNVT